MEIIWDNTIYKWKFIEMWVLDIEKANWQVWKWEYAKRKNNQSAVSALVENITNNSFVLVEQFRWPVNKKVIELVAGLCDKEWYSKEQIITEEILEETWYTATQIMHLIENSPQSAGIISELWDTFYAKVEWKRWAQCLWDFESIDVLEFEKKDLNKFLNSKRKEWVLISDWIYTVIWNMLARWINILN